MARYFLDGVLLLILGICLYTDLKERKILNKVTFSGALAGFVLNILFQGPGGIIFGLKGFFVGVGLLLLPFVAGGLGAGDVKLMGVIGVIKGAECVFYVFLLSAIIGGFFSLFVLIKQKRLLLTLKEIIIAMKMLLFSGFKVNIFPSMSSSNPAGQGRIPYAPAIVAGAMIAILFPEVFDYLSVKLWMA